MIDRERVQPIRLGGKSVLQFVDGFEPSASLLTSPETILNVAEVLMGAGFVDDEIAFLDATRIDGLSFAQLHRALGWNASKVDRVRKSVAAKLKGIAAAQDRSVVTLRYSGGDSVHLSYEASVRTWSLATISPDVVAEELARSRRKSLFISTLPETEIESTKSRECLRIMRLTEVQSRLRIERLKLSEILEKSHDARLEIAAAEDDLGKLNADVAEDSISSILEDGRKPDASLAKRFAAAEKRVTDARAREGAFNGAIERQQAKVDALEGEISNRRTEAFRLDLGNAPAELLLLRSNWRTRSKKLRRSPASTSATTSAANCSRTAAARRTRTPVSPIGQAAWGSSTWRSGSPRNPALKQKPRKRRNERNHHAENLQNRTNIGRNDRQRASARRRHSGQTHNR